MTNHVHFAADSVPEEKYSPKVQKIIEYLEHGDRPWFLSSVEIYVLVKKTVEALPYSQALLDQSLVALSQLTKYINENTTAKLVLDVDQAHDLIEKIDSILSEQLVVLDDGLDGVRAKLSSQLRQLLTALVNHKKWAESKADETKDAAFKSVQTRYEVALGFVNRLVEVARARLAVVTDLYEKSVEKVQATKAAAEQYVQDINNEVKSFSSNIRNKVDSQTIGSILYLLQVAQPYVHKLVNTSAPLVSKTLQVSQPYIEQAKPHVEKIVSRAVDVTNTLKENKYVGSYVDTALVYAQVAIDETKGYVIPPAQAQ